MTSASSGHHKRAHTALQRMRGVLTPSHSPANVLRNKLAFKGLKDKAETGGRLQPSFMCLLYYQGVILVCGYTSVLLPGKSDTPYNQYQE